MGFDFLDKPCQRKMHKFHPRFHRFLALSDCGRHRVRPFQDRLDRLLHVRRIRVGPPTTAAGHLVQSDHIAAEDAEGEPAAVGEEHVYRWPIGLRGNPGQQLAK